MLNVAKNVIAYLLLSIFCALALLGRFGVVGQYAGSAMRAVLGSVAWLLPAWFANSAWRSLMGMPWSFRQAAGTLFGLLVCCTTFGLCKAQGGWVGLQSAGVLLETVDVGAYLIVGGVWIVGLLHLVGHDRLEALAELASEAASHALEDIRPMLQRPTEELVGSGPGRAVPPPLPLPLPLPAPSAPQTTVSAPPTHGVMPVASAAPAPTVHSHRGQWQLPSSQLFQAATVRNPDRKYLADVARNLEERLDLFGIDATVKESQIQGALLYRLEITPGPSQKIGQITERQEDLDAAYAGLSFVALPGTGKLGVEIPIPKTYRGQINIREVLDSKVWTNTDAALPLALGTTAAGDPAVIDLAEGPHLLVAGTTGSGKSVGVNTMLVSMLVRNSPDDLQLMIVDPKTVDLAAFEGIPHLIAPIITEVSEAIEKLRWTCAEMETRYAILRAAKVKNIVEYNAKTDQRMARLVFIVDEYSDLCIGSKSDKEKVEKLLVRLAQKARAAGIHVILATQRPSADVVSSVIKANFPARIAYKVKSLEDSRTVLGTGLWDRHKQLIGKGDSLVDIPGFAESITRVHGAYVDEREVEAVCDFWRNQAAALPAVHVQPKAICAEIDGATDEPSVVQPAVVTQQTSTPAAPVAPPAEPKSREDDLYEKAIVIAKEKGEISQRDIEAGLSCNIQTSRRVFDRLKRSGVIKPGGRNNKHAYAEPN